MRQAVPHRFVGCHRTLRMNTDQCRLRTPHVRDGACTPMDVLWMVDSRPECNRAAPLDLQPLLAHRGVLAHVLGGTLEDDGAVAHDVEALGDVEGDGELLLDQ